ncbi:MAG: FecR domain-containing protein [Candidatus Methylopumilus sp.]|jgi:transmembrane sensor
MAATPKIKSLRETAIKWFMRVQKMDAEHPDRSRFEAWLMADPLHQRAYAEVEGLWENLDSTPQVERLVSALDKKQHISSAKKLKSTFAALGFIVLAAAGVLGYHTWQAQPVMQMIASASMGQIKSQVLSDGSKLTINANSDVEITYYRHQRHVTLKRGEAIFEVARDESRPFVVDSGRAKVTVLGTRFAVNRLQHLVRVSVDHGRVQVESLDTEGKPGSSNIILSNGEVAEVSAQQPANQPSDYTLRRINRPAADAFSFAQGLISFNDAGLEEITETLSRYRTPAVIVQHTAGGQPHITAVIKAHNVEKFLKSLPDLAPVTVQYRPEQTLVVSEPSRQN